MAKRIVRLAIVGCGTISRAGGPGYVGHPNCEVVALCDPVRERAEERAKEWGIAPKIYTGYDDVLNDPNVEAVELLTPTHMHPSQSIAALEAGKHVSCQKPVSKDVAGADQIARAVKSAKTVFRVTENFLYYPPIIKAKELLDKGVIGEPSLIRLRTTTGRTKKYDHITLEKGALTWRRDPKLNPGGGIYDSGWHRFATAVWWGGGIEHISAIITRTADFLTESPSACIWKYTGRDCLGILEDVLTPQMEIRGKYYPVDDFFEIVGSKGIIWVTRCTGELLDLPPVVVIKGSATTDIQVPSDWMEGFNGAAADFVDSIIKGEQPKMDIAFSKQVLQVTLAAYQASDSGKQVAPSAVK